MIESDQSRFWGKVSLPDASGCMVWLGATNKKGYGNFWLDGSMKRASRVSLELATGSAPADRQAAHGCTTKACVAPEHLSWKTRAENEADKLRDGTSNEGQRNPSAKLTEQQVIEIRSIRGASLREIARRYGVTDMTIHAIVHGKTWRNI